MLYLTKKEILYDGLKQQLKALFCKYFVTSIAVLLLSTCPNSLNTPNSCVSAAG